MSEKGLVDYAELKSIQAKGDLEIWCSNNIHDDEFRAELAAIAQALQQANIAEPVILLVDSTAALRRIARFQSHEFRPDWESCKDPDIMKIIIDIICARQAFV
jgi:ribonuclease HI